jgi:hypothetical protein
MELIGEKVLIRYLEIKDAEALLQLVQKSKFFSDVYGYLRTGILYFVKYNESRGAWTRKI